VATIETPDPGRVRIRPKRAWPDFMTFYNPAHRRQLERAGRYVEKVGDEGFKKARSAPARTVRSYSRASSWWSRLRPVLAQDAEREALV